MPPPREGSEARYTTRGAEVAFPQPGNYGLIPASGAPRPVARRNAGIGAEPAPAAVARVRRGGAVLRAGSAAGSRPAPGPNGSGGWPNCVRIVRPYGNGRAHRPTHPLIN
ncbi:hypothetical protein GCM10010211_23520 [Streptomyces albospinus]|uniref:Uncharacterized protein n=1 Tax=Streptomyces albospinus TaxID=285515 RepID=A0ABQ2UWV4_9ACTN|nr:hypothetical protein GCM10010211_23520 [Streptomyces albospinus]